MQSLKPKNVRGGGDYDSDTLPANVQPEVTVRGGASIRQYHVLNDKRHILTKDTENNIALWDVLTVSKIYWIFFLFVQNPDTVNVTCWGVVAYYEI